MISVLTKIQFPLTIFLYCCQTWENKESEFQEFTFLQSNTAQEAKFLVVALEEGRRKRKKK